MSKAWSRLEAVLLGLIAAACLGLLLDAALPGNVGPAEPPQWEEPGEPAEGGGEPAAETAEQPEERPPRAPAPDEKTAAELLRSSPVVEHALGEAGGIPVLNCREGFLAAYEKGVRVFEADLRLTADDAVVLRHDWRAGWQEGISERSLPTLREFLAAPVLGQYTALSFRDLLDLMAEYPDVCVVTDSKFIDAEVVTKEFRAMVEDAGALGLEHVFSRMAVQVYSPLMFSVVDNIYHFPCYIYTLYQDGFTGTAGDFQQRADFCRENGILGITMWHTSWRDEFLPIARGYGLMCFVHTVNDAAYARELLARGIDAVYTDTLTPDDF